MKHWVVLSRNLNILGIKISFALLGELQYDPPGLKYQRLNQLTGSVRYQYFNFGNKFMR